tara:strand:- start:33756 stop:34520 length:765 start_codon:yes stop_codon:yes gene_type:complete
MSVGKDKASAASAARETSRVTGTDDTASALLSDDAVREFLKNNGDFLQRNPDLLDHLHVSHASGSAVSLVEKQVSVLRERNVDIRHRLNDLTAHARDNDKLFEQTRALVIELLEANSVTELYRAFSESMRTGFELEFATMILFGDNTEEKNYRVETAELAQANIGALLSGQKAVCGALRREEFSYLFAKDGNTHKFHQGGSAAVVPLNDGAQLGLIAIGSSNANRFTSDMGTLFLSHIADVILRLLPRMTGAGS